MLDALPAMTGVEPATVRRLLSGAWLDVVRLRDLKLAPDRDVTDGLRRVATALEVRLFVGSALDAEAQRAAAFVAAECLGIAREQVDARPQENDDPDPHLTLSPGFVVLEEALLYVIAGFDSNAALTAADVSNVTADAFGSPAAAWASEHVSALIDHTKLVPSSAEPQRPSDLPLRERVRHELWLRAGKAVAAHVRWLRMLDNNQPNAGDQLRELAFDLRDPARPSAVIHADIYHLCLLLAKVCDETAARALRRVPPPANGSVLFEEYQQARARRTPLLWPGAARYAELALPGPARHAVVTVPTGAGKSAVAELAAAQALGLGWVLYLAPTNALVRQIRRDLARSMGPLSVNVRGLTGGAEFSIFASDDTLDLAIGTRTIAVMTPEKCSLALRQNPEIFATLALCVLDEAHLIRDGESRGVVAELVLSEVMHRAPNIRLLLMSALVENSEPLAEWLSAATGIEAVSVSEPWRPTRTLRALAGIDAEATKIAEIKAVNELARLSRSRTTHAETIPIRLLGALHGTWTGEDPGDYEIVDTAITFSARIPRSGSLPRTGYTSPVSKAITQALADAGHRVLTFLPGSRHFPFSHAKHVAGRTVDELSPEVQTLLMLADTEISGVGGGEVTEVRTALKKGVAVHTSVMTVEEQRASELAFESGAAQIMLATATLAQGLNLPATAVVIGGTTVGDRRQAGTPEARARTKAQLLNAIGRAGRAQIAARALAVVVPSRPVRIASAPEIDTIRSSAPFLSEEDGSTEISSRLDGLIADALGDSLQLATMSVPEQTAFAFLSFTAESGDATAVLARTLAAHTAGASQAAERVAMTLRALGREFLDDQHAGAWIATAAHRAGVSVPNTAALQHALRSRLDSDDEPPTDVLAWASLLVDVLTSAPLDIRLSLFDGEHLDSTALTAIRGDRPEAQDRAAEVLRRVLTAWLEGEPLTVVGARLHALESPVNVTRASGKPLPRTIRFVREGIEHRLASLAGALVAIVVTGAEADPDGPWQIAADSLSALGRLPVAIRIGAADPAVVALSRAGVGPRVVAHMLGRVAAPPEPLADDQYGHWASGIVQRLAEADFVDGLTTKPSELAVLRAAAHLQTFM